ncbi:predicted protein [Histoplasma mississippiense (nom. inval.)]|uniref:predicted protein n=1 Tax=Ajellomyces capsulatus (strain NAm1 / WU24) TaxID=2059318 RepID=UPI000157BA31|nr:predicted protein [Histoplasma mississippiense (nom. inval.)]EDN03405.1 predicted protein [Histoplasma mississippiense (nom. inval.)]
MPAKKASASKAASSHASYRDMIKDAIINLKERNGSSRQALKKYVQANNNINITSQSAFDTQFNRAVKTGVEKGDFTQPKGEATHFPPKPAVPQKGKSQAALESCPSSCQRTQGHSDDQVWPRHKITAKATPKKKTTGTKKATKKATPKKAA